MLAATGALTAVAVVLGLAHLGGGHDLASARSGGPAARPAPNIVFIIVDDEPATNGSLTDFMPNVRSIFRDHGVTFTDLHSETPLCCPARAGFLTGQHTHNHGLWYNASGGFHPEMTIATQLHGVGYHTILIGKYLNGWGRCCAPAMPPGWDRFTAFAQPPGPGGAYYDYVFYNDGDPTPENHGTAPVDYSTDVIAAKALDRLRSTPASQPVFLYVAPFAPHSPTMAAPRYGDDTSCNSVPYWKPADWNEADVSDKPLYVQQQPLLKQDRGQALFKECRSLLAVDDLVGRLRDELAAEGRLNNTLMIYSGDNGMEEGEHRLLRKYRPYVTTLPFYMAWPARLGNAPRTVGERLENIDLAPTLCDIAGCKLGPYWNGQTGPDGRSFAPLLFARQTSLGRDAVLEQGAVEGRFPGWADVTTTAASPFARQGCSSAATGGCRWRYVEYSGTGERELYDDSNGPCWKWKPGEAGDPCELQNQITNPDYATLISALHDRLAQLRTERGS